VSTSFLLAHANEPNPPARPLSAIIKHAIPSATTARS